MIAIGMRPAVAEPRISAAAFFGRTFVPDSLREEARQVTVPLRFLMRWDDEGMERQPVLDLFHAVGTGEPVPLPSLGSGSGSLRG
ncbi:hypothetical protein ACFVH0_10515 [Streptomyces sp. NPDC127117]|uniref:hypothetical protein n=1 Tax=Streptomyces sp. NPDC127117 TaxID=3345368 RepID=UPI0036426D20